MNSYQSLTREARASLILAFPLMVGQVSQMLIGVSDTLMIGHVGVVPLAASTFANTIIHLPFMFGIGMAIAVSVRVSQARGANDPEAARAALRHGLLVTLGLGVLTVVFAVGLLPFLPALLLGEVFVARDHLYHFLSRRWLLAQALDGAASLIWNPLEAAGNNLRLPQPPLYSLYVNTKGIRRSNSHKYVIDIKTADKYRLNREPAFRSTNLK